MILYDDINEIPFGKKLAEIEISFIVHLVHRFSCSFIGKHLLCTSANHIYDTVISLETLWFNAFIAYVGHRIHIEWQEEKDKRKEQKLECSVVSV